MTYRSSKEAFTTLHLNALDLLSNVEAKRTPSAPKQAVQLTGFMLLSDLKVMAATNNPVATPEGTIQP